MCQAVEDNLSGRGSADVKLPTGYIFPEPKSKFGLLQNAINAFLDHNVPQVRI